MNFMEVILSMSIWNWVTIMFKISMAFVIVSVFWIIVAAIFWIIIEILE